MAASAALAQGTGRPPADFPPDWAPAGLEGARERDTGVAVEVFRDVGGVEVTAPRTFQCRVGYREELGILLSKRSDLEKHVTIVGAGPRGVSLDVTSVDMPKKRLGQVTPAVQTLLLHPTHLLLKVTISKEEGLIPVRLAPQPTYPIFALGGLPVGLDETGRNAALLAALELPAQCLRLPADDTEAWLALLRQKAEIAPQACLSVNLAAEGWEGRLRELAAERGDQVAYWQLQAPPPLPAADQEPEAAAVAAFAGLMRRASGIVHQAAPTAVLLSPPLRAWSTEGAPQARLLRALGERQLELGAIVVEYAPPPVPAGAAAEVWAEMDRAADLRMVRGAVDAAGLQDTGLWWVRQAADGGDARLEALRVVRDVVLAASAGVMGIECRPSPSAVEVWQPQVAASDQGIAALGEAMAELAGAAPCGEWGIGEGNCSSEPGSPITFRHFFRGDEGIVFLWSNAPKRVAFRLALRQEPLGLRLLTLSPKGTLIERKTDLEFVAEKRDKQGHYLVDGELGPLEVRAYSFPLRAAHRGWLAAVRRA